MIPARALSIAAAIAAVSALLLFAAAAPVSRTVDRTRIYMGTVVEIKVAAKGAADIRNAETAIDKAFDEIGRVESVFSVYRADSEVSKVNRLAKAERLVLSREAFDLIAMSRECSRKTGGAFDITVKPLVDLWIRARSDGQMPGKAEVAEALERTGFEKMQLDDGRRAISFGADGMAIDLGGIAKGYAAERAASILVESGIRDAVVNCGGDIFCLGRRPDARPWKIGIRHPRDRAKVFDEIAVHDEAIVTSGDYEKFSMIGGKRVSHIIDPRSGYPVGDNVVSATVIARSAPLADALATALCVDAETGMRAVRDYGGRAIIIVKKGDTFVAERSW